VGSGSHFIVIPLQAPAPLAQSKLAPNIEQLSPSFA
jgi:hypothetical protein